MQKIIDFISKNYIYIIFLIGAAGVFTSLYYSNVENLTPCVLCWYQRILFYPIFILSIVAITFKEKLSPKYILALAIPGALIALYQYSMQKFGLTEAAFVPCELGIPCSKIDVEYFGFITIPFMSLVGFVAFTIVSLIKIKFPTKNP